MTYFLNYYSQGQCCGLIDLMREYQNLKSAVTKVLENATNVIATKTTVKDQEDLKWALSKVIIHNVFRHNVFFRLFSRFVVYS